MEERRKPRERERPYRELRAVAKIYSFLAPLGGGVILFAGALTIAARLGNFYSQVVGGVLSVIAALVYYLILKAYAQSLYILFDIAGNTKKIRELVEGSGGQTP